jgi:hypothetical protein
MTTFRDYLYGIELPGQLFLFGLAGYLTPGDAVGVFNSQLFFPEKIPCNQLNQLNAATAMHSRCSPGLLVAGQ